ncbi:hypothetical protein DAI22_04g129900 [Oryza sativa Japonica Group]|nr:hypothetical protein DAI22_04g129900 [Oryza sativa Japonica Group]
MPVPNRQQRAFCNRQCDRVLFGREKMCEGILLGLRAILKYGYVNTRRGKQLSKTPWRGKLEF